MSEFRELEGSAPGQEPAVEPAAEPAETSTPPPPPDPLDALLREYDDANPPAPAPAPAPEGDGTLERLLIEDQDRLNNTWEQRLSTQQTVNDAYVSGLKRVAEVATAQLEQRLRQDHIRAETREFNAWCEDGQKKLPEHCPDGYFRRWMVSEGMSNPTLQLAYDLRNIDPAHAAAELHRANEVHAVLVARGAPAEKIAQVAEYAQQAAVAMNARQILATARGRCIEEARKMQPIDPDATADRAAVTAAVRGATTKVAAEPAPNLGRMDDREFRAYTQQFGF